MLRGHPWIFSGSLASVHGSPDAPIARVLSADGRPLALGFFASGSRIPVRVLSRDRHTIEASAINRRFFAERLQRAQTLRAAVVPPDTTGYRVLNAEGDGVPGWTVDRFGDVLVSQITARGLEVLRDEAYAALREAFPTAAILQRNRVAARKQEELALEDEVIAGDVPALAPFHEHGIALQAEITTGQKTGFYCDQRENRSLAGRLAGDRETLDLFAHSGAFALYALRGGARHVVAIESSPRLAEIARTHFEMNAVTPDRISWLSEDVFSDLRQRTEQYALVICDPPPFVPRHSDLDRGSRAYKDLNRLALRRVAPGGFFLTFTCSGAVDAKLFRQILHSAAEEAGVRVSLLAPLGAAPDHPIDLSHPEGEYLKGWLCRVAE